MKRSGKLAVAIFLLGLASEATSADDPFPEPEALRPSVEFWLRIYSEVPTHAGLLHDTEHLDVVYGLVEYPKGAGHKERERISTSARETVENALRDLSRGQRTNLTPTQKRVLESWPEGVRSETLAGAASRVRLQSGQSDRFQAGLARSGRWRPYIHKALDEAGVPVALVALPHVESSFNPEARSRLGATGLWQFTRPTARRFMRVDHVMDERLDPYASSVAAAQLLAHNRKVTGTWPLAITAYNHGAGGVRRAMSRTGSSDIAVIIEKYDGPAFGFASRNFYAEFLAARRIDADPEKYFGKQPPSPPVELETARLEGWVPAKALVGHLGVDEDLVRRSNPALLETVWAGAKHVPKDYVLRLPRSAIDEPLEAALKSLPDRFVYAKQIPDLQYTVARGDALSRIAARYGVTQRQLIALNGLRNANHIRIGQRLTLPFAQDPKDLADLDSYRGARTARGLYRVRPGDTLSEIAVRHDIPVAELARLNGLANQNRIHPGQSLRLSASAPNPAGDDAGGLVDPGVAAPPSAGLEGDPTDYTVAPDGTIEVQATETLGHYAEWLGIPTHDLQQRNGSSGHGQLEIGRRVQLDFREVSQDDFEKKRLEHHRALQRAFFERYEIVSTRTHRARRGESLWWLAEKHFGIPLWLLRQYNPGLDGQNLRVGTSLTAPRVRPHGDRSQTGQ